MGHYPPGKGYFEFGNNVDHYYYSGGDPAKLFKDEVNLVRGAT